MSTFTMKHLSQTLVFDPYKNTFEELQTTGDKPPVAEGQRVSITKFYLIYYLRRPSYIRTLCMYSEDITRTITIMNSTNSIALSIIGQK